MVDDGEMGIHSVDGRRGRGSVGRGGGGGRGFGGAAGKEVRRSRENAGCMSNIVGEPECDSETCRDIVDTSSAGIMVETLCRVKGELDDIHREAYLMGCVSDVFSTGDSPVIQAGGARMASIADDSSSCRFGAVLVKVTEGIVCNEAGVSPGPSRASMSVSMASDSRGYRHQASP